MTLTLDPLPPPLHLPRLALEEAAVAPPSAEVAAHLSDCASCRSHVETLQLNAARFLETHPSDRFLRQLAGRRLSPPQVWLPAVGLLAAACMATLAGVTHWAGPWQELRQPAQAVQLKGSLVSTFVQRRGEAVQLRAGETLHPKDAVRFVVRSEQAGYAAVFERDPDGRVTVIAPFGASRPQAVPPGSTALADSAILDSTVGKERFVAVFSTESFAISPLVGALSAEHEVACNGCRVEALEFDKSP